MSSTPEEKLKEKLNLKYSAASTLIKDVRERSPELADKDEELVQAAADIFQYDLSKGEQEEMKAPPVNNRGSSSSGLEPDWQTRARIAAEKREQQWEAEAAAKAAGLPPPEQAKSNSLPPNVVSQTTTRQVGMDEPVVVESLTQEVKLKEPNDENTRKSTCYCVIL